MKNDRVYSLWCYAISHGILIIRSPKKDVYELTVDYVFKCVEHINCPYKMTNLIIEEKGKQFIVAENEDANIYKLKCDEGVFEIIAFSMWKKESKLDAMDITPYLP